MTSNTFLPSNRESLSPKEMHLLEHLAELRQRVFKSFAVLVIGTLVGLLIATPVMEYLQRPYGREFTVLGPTGGVVAYFRVALTIGAVLAIPLVTYQLLMFVLPGLMPKERRIVLTALPAFTILFIIGAAFAWFILIPPALGFLEGFQPTLFKPEWTTDQYLGFVTSLIFWMGVAFEMPLVFFVMALIGVVTAPSLVKNWRVAIVISAIAAALITPTVDPVNMFLVMGPLLTLYILSILLVIFGARLNKSQSNT
jgi:sec-independent protein translocase protein TatC